MPTGPALNPSRAGTDQPEQVPDLHDIHRLLQLTRLSRSDDLDEVLAEVARCVADVLGYRAVVVNLRRPAWDDFEVVHVEGDEASREALLGTTNSRAQWESLLQPRFQRRGAYLLLHGEYDAVDLTDGYVPDIAPSDDPEAWHPLDMLCVPLLDDEEQLVGVLSVDEPASGRRPTDEDLDLLVAVTSHASVALANARKTMEAARLRAALDDLLRLSHRTGSERPLDEALEDVCTAVQRGLGFTRVAVLLAGPDGDRLVRRASVGFDEGEREAMAPLRLSGLAPILDPRFAREGCQLVAADVAERIVDQGQAIYASTNNGRGGRAWEGHWLNAPLHDADGAIVGILWADDPEDRLLPDADGLRALRLFADQAAAAIAQSEHVAHLRHLAHHDPLTGVLNRRGLTERLEGLLGNGGPVSLVFADLDHFKRVNDDRGHDAGDALLRRFGAVLRRAAAVADGVAVRLGGEEFALVLPGFDGERALAAAEALRATGAAALGEQVPGMTLSAGVATSGPAVPDAASLLRAADQALYAAKRLGRDRCVRYDPALPAIDRRLAGEGATHQTLSAVLLLAGALDLRDASTAEHSRTVARLAEVTARTLGLEPARVERIRTAGALHDLGKIAVPDAILRKEGGLTDAEWAEIRRHPEVGAQILQHAGLDDIATWVLGHHERMDGRGYPFGVPGDRIPLEARVLSVADAFEAMTADRPYRRAMPVGEALAELRRCAGSQFDPLVVDAFERALALEPVLAS